MNECLINRGEYLNNPCQDRQFYTNRTVVKLMTQITDPHSSESIYDPTCGSGGILLSAALHLKEQGKEYRTLKLYGQELNLITSRLMNIF